MTTWSYYPATDHGLAFHERNRSLSCERGLTRRTLQAVSWGFLRTYLRLAHDLRTEGLAHLPEEGPYVVVANHSSHLDALVLGAALSQTSGNRPYLLAAGDTFFRNRFRAACSSLFLNALPMWRASCPRRALAELRNKMTAPGSDTVLVLFPEGTRSRSGQLGSFKAGIGALVAGTEVQVVPACITGAYEAWPPHRSRPHRGGVTLRIGQPRRFTDVVDERKGWNRVAQTLEADVRRLQAAISVTPREERKLPSLETAVWSP